MTAKEKLQEHSNEFRKEVITVVPKIHVAVGYASSNSIMIEGDTSLIIVDTTESLQAAENVLAEFRKLSNKPIKTIFLTHSHRDHVSGASVFAQENNPKIYSRAFSADVLGPKGIANIQRLRAKRQFGIGLSQEENINLGLGPSNRPLKGLGQGVLEATDVVTEDGMVLEVDGVRLELHFAPGETDDTMIIYLPEQNILIGADNYYKSFPNLYPVRGGPYRDIATWVASLDKMIAFEAEYLIPGHSRPLSGKAHVQDILTNYRNALAYVLEETLKGIDAGKTPDQLVEDIQLPEELASLEYLQEFYGTVEWSIRSIFTGYLGWFDGNPSQLFQPTMQEDAQGLADLAGGIENLEVALEENIQKQNYPWALKLVDALIQLNVKGAKAKKAIILRSFAEKQLNATARNYFLSYTKELEEMS